MIVVQIWSSFYITKHTPASMNLVRILEEASLHPDLAKSRKYTGEILFWKHTQYPIRNISTNNQIYHSEWSDYELTLKKLQANTVQRHKRSFLSIWKWVNLTACIHEHRQRTWTPTKGCASFMYTVLRSRTQSVGQPAVRNIEALHGQILFIHNFFVTFNEKNYFKLQDLALWNYMCT